MLQIYSKKYWAIWTFFFVNFCKANNIYLNEERLPQKSTENKFPFLQSRLNQQECGKSIVKNACLGKIGYFNVKTDTTKFPWLARIEASLKTNETQVCMGTLIAPLWVLTSKTCLLLHNKTVAMEDIKVYLKEVVLMEVQEIRLHMNELINETLSNSLLLKLKDNQNKTSFIPVCLTPGIKENSTHYGPGITTYIRNRTFYESTILTPLDCIYEKHYGDHICHDITLFIAILSLKTGSLLNPGTPFFHNVNNTCYLGGLMVQESKFANYSIAFFMRMISFFDWLTNQR